MILRRRAAPAAVLTAAVFAAALTVAAPSGADDVVARARLIDNSDHRVGQVKFTTEEDGTVKGHVVVHLPLDSAEFHGLHIHANTAGTGCVAGTGFTGAGGHWDVGGHDHGAHTGDLPSLQRQSDGESQITFIVDKYAAADLVGKAVIVHVGPDNFGNVPRGTATNQYTDNGTAYSGTGGTAATGNAGARFACGVIEPA
jgi:superoxide dismutase, Cu-Zn family